MKKLMMTGGSGFIAAHFARRLREDGVDFVSIDIYPPAGDEEGFRRADVRDPAAVREAIRGCDAVLHLAAAHHDYGITEQTFFDVNETGARVLCDAMDDEGVRELCFFSSVAVYGDAPPPLTEETEPRPASHYGRSKLAAERVFQEWTKKGDGRRCLVIRPTVTFGVGNFANLYKLIRQIDSGRFLPVGSGENIKSLSYVENIVDATLYLWGRDEGSRPAFDVYNWIDKPDLSSMEITRAVYDALGRRFPRVRAPLWLAMLAATPFDVITAVTGRNLPVSRARVHKLYAAQTKFEADKVKRAGYEPAVPLREGLRRMVEWYLEEGKNASPSAHLPPAETVG